MLLAFAVPNCFAGLSSLCWHLSLGIESGRTYSVRTCTLDCMPVPQFSSVVLFWCRFDTFSLFKILIQILTQFRFTVPEKPPVSEPSRICEFVDLEAHYNKDSKSLGDILKKYNLIKQTEVPCEPASACSTIGTTGCLKRNVETRLKRQNVHRNVQGFAVLCIALLRGKHWQARTPWNFVSESMTRQYFVSGGLTKREKQKKQKRTGS